MLSARRGWLVSCFVDRFWAAMYTVIDLIWPCRLCVLVLNLEWVVAQGNCTSLAGSNLQAAIPRCFSTTPGSLNSLASGKFFCHPRSRERVHSGPIAAFGVSATGPGRNGCGGRLQVGQRLASGTAISTDDDQLGRQQKLPATTTIHHLPRPIPGQLHIPTALRTQTNPPQ
jgi:hypothetical protein